MLGFVSMLIAVTGLSLLMYFVAGAKLKHLTGSVIHTARFSIVPFFENVGIENNKFQRETSFPVLIGDSSNIIRRQLDNESGINTKPRWNYGFAVWEIWRRFFNPSVANIDHGFAREFEGWSSARIVQANLHANRLFRFQRVGKLHINYGDIWPLLQLEGPFSGLGSISGNLGSIFSGISRNDGRICADFGSVSRFDSGGHDSVGEVGIEEKNNDTGYFSPKFNLCAAFLAAFLAGFLLIVYGWWNIKFGPQNWRGLVAFLLGVACLFYSASLFVEVTVQGG